MTRTQAAVSLTGAVKSFGGVEVLRGVDFEIGRGEVVSLIGPSGAGKSTLLRCLTLLERLDAGSLSYGDATVCTGSPVAQYDKDQMQRARMRFGLVFQHYNLFPHRSVLENVCDAPIVVQRRNPEEVKAQAHGLLERLGLSSIEHAVPCQLSGGQQQRVAIARALCMNPDVMYFDEATAALDPRLTKDMHELIRQLAEGGMAVGIVTHEMEFARSVSDRVCLLIDGKIVENGPAEQVMRNPHDAGARAFLGLTAD